MHDGDFGSFLFTQDLVNANIVVVVAAGNDGQDASNFSPGREPMAITVGSSTSTDAQSSFSK
jgi:serine protease